MNAITNKFNDANSTPLPLKLKSKSAIHAIAGLAGAVALVLGAQAFAQITLYEHEGFRGRVFSASRQVSNLTQYGFNDRASSVIVERGRWEVCEDVNFQGQCAVLRKGSYDSLRGLGLNDRISSMRAVNNRANYENEAPEPLAAPSYDYRRRPNERLYEAPVTYSRAVYGQPSQRCWVDREQVNEPIRGDANVGGAILGGILGGVLGHQVGGGRGRDVATAVGVLGGGAVGANVGRNNNNITERDVRRCETVQNGRPEQWDVRYNFQGVEHNMQMTSQPGTTITVNRNGEPRL